MRRLTGAAIVAAVLLTGGVTDAASWNWHLPAGVAPPPVPSDNPMSAAKVELGRRLFYDADLSLDGTTSCATCHGQHRAFIEGNPTHGGVQGALGRRNVMGLANVAYFDPLTWADPSQHRLETQILVPLMGTQPVEMGMAGKTDALAERLGADPCYRQMFAAAFPEGEGRIDLGTVTKSLAAFERILLSFDSPYDRYARGDRSAISDAAKRGAALFSGRLNCAGCHAGGNFTDGKFHAIGLYNVDGRGGYPAGDHGLREITGAPADEGAIRTPSLRNVALTGPYMHDGSVTGLADAVRRHYAPANPLRDPTLNTAMPDDGELDDAVAFLESLSDPGFVTNPALALPKAACGKPL